MEQVQFIFWEALKAFGLALLALVAIKAISHLRPAGNANRGKPSKGLQVALYAMVFALAILGARGIGRETAAEIYFWAAARNLEASNVVKGYLNAAKAVELRPGVLRYWQTLARAKVMGQQYASLLQDQPAFESLEGADWNDDDRLRFALCHLALRQYDQVIPMTQRLVEHSPIFAEAYVVQGSAYTGLKQYAQAEHSFLKALDIYPSQTSAVEGLAHLYFVTGQTGKALGVLNATAKYPFSPEARKRFAALQGLYEQ